jgi:hypothetical protein
MNYVLSARTLFLMFLCTLLFNPLQSNADDDVKLKDLKVFGTAGKELSVLKPGVEAELFKEDGAGVLTHMWFGGDWNGYLRTRLRIYVDGETKPSIDMQLGLGVGIGFEDTNPWGIARMGKTGNHSGLYNTFRIPFGKGVRVTAQLADDVKEEPVFWWIIRGTKNLPIRIGDVKLPADARLHLYKNEALEVKPLDLFDLCKTKKAGALYLVTMAASTSGEFNYLEGQMRAYVDGADEPLMLSSGLEDYFLGTYYFQRGRYYTPVAGLTHIDNNNKSFSAYRFHDDDPLFFSKGLRLTCRCGEKSGDKQFGPGDTGNLKATTYTTYAWVYEW